MAESDDWKDLCRAIMIEKDPARLMNLVDQLNRELETRERELRRKTPANDSELDSFGEFSIGFAS
ncbi:MAG TPA: hypothetical protein VEG30_15315 [Terriglobales bacterium]|nr:hypothetical protein [Terriglobales bacterium]